jgi:hypothetical protein
MGLPDPLYESCQRLQRDAVMLVGIQDADGHPEFLGHNSNGLG